MSLQTSSSTCDLYPTRGMLVRVCICVSVRMCVRYLGYSVEKSAFWLKRARLAYCGVHAIYRKSA
ncbi:hypothetical protein BGX38DRAFT_1184456 [Terfezia claveryi]|nr:hypothetical protein BGX38DRAFT_1184456 [Terfezia claveryi]